MFKKVKLVSQRGFSGVGLAFTAMLAAVFAALGLYVTNEIMFATDMVTNSGGTAHEVVGLWTLFPLLFPFIAIAAIILGIYGMYKYFGE